jgi:hypothetical protein
MQADFPIQLQLGRSAQGLPQDLSLKLQLSTGLDMLILTASTAPKVLTLWNDAVSRRSQDLLQSRSRKPRTAFNDRCVNPLPRDHIGQKDGLTAAVFVGRQTGQAIPAVDEFFDV